MYSSPASSLSPAALTGYRFEKSLYDLIRGIRNHKGNEKEYIQNCLKECRTEIRNQDMGLSPHPPAMSRPAPF